MTFFFHSFIFHSYNTGTVLVLYFIHYLSSCCLAMHVPFPTSPSSTGILILMVYDASDGADPVVPATQFAKSLVLSRPDQVHPALVVWLLIEEPIAIPNIAGEDIIHMEAIHDAATVVHQIHHLTFKL